MEPKRIDSFSSQGVRHTVYRAKGVSAQNISIYYRDWARWRGYKVLTWGGGDTYTGKNAGSGWGITARSKKCGYLEVNVGQTAKGPSYPRSARKDSSRPRALRCEQEDWCKQRVVNRPLCEPDRSPQEVCAHARFAHGPQTADRSPCCAILSLWH